MYIKRKIEGTINKFLDAEEIIAIVGPRRSGKTTMVTEIMKKVKNPVLLSFEDKAVLDMFENREDEFIERYVKPNSFLFIDEFQYAKNGGQKLKYIFDTDTTKTKIIISGSSNIDLVVHTVKYLVGRILIFELFPFSFEEFLSYKDSSVLIKLKKEQELFINFNDEYTFSLGSETHNKLLKYYEEYLIYGGYPRVVLTDDVFQKKVFLKNIYDTYFLREVKDVMGLIDDYKLFNLIKALSFQISNIIEYKELSNLSGYSFNALKKYMNFLEKTYIMRLVRPYFKNRRTELVKNPKIFFVDTGLRNLIVDNFEKLDKRDDKGALVENGLMQEFIKKEYDVNFWRDKKKNEIDFILHLSAGKKVAIESKYKLKSSNTSSTKTFENKYSDINIYFSYYKNKKEISDKKHLPIYLY